ncbi:hypothetical protein MIMGU_mgv1a015803mg [Erythranthe guttata]|uniref:Uncharacterized protein n=1 Tax=Erythranthe guttata TaxID=4155 RepID=A0A022RP45_ERYGU|nr:hypothetical protein MIMGU_mgv1a015803mg [Erythranthe guttata]
MYIEKSAKIRPGFLGDRNRSPEKIPKNPDFRRIPQIIKADILLLHHPGPGEITPCIMYPYVWVTRVIIVINQVSHSSITSFSRHVSPVNILALQSLRTPWFHRVDFLQHRSDSYLQLDRLVARVPYPRSGPRYLSAVAASVEASR